MLNGWLKLHRKAINSDVFSEPIVWQLFCWCLMKANIEESCWKGEMIPRGSFVTGRRAAATELNTTEGKYRRTLKRLENFGNVTIKSTSKFSVITVVNYEQYQHVDKKTTNKPTGTRPTNRPVPDQQIDRYPTTEEEVRRKNKEEEIPTYQGGDFKKLWESACKLMDDRHKTPEIKQAFEDWHLTRKQGDGVFGSVVGLNADTVRLALKQCSTRDLDDRTTLALISDAAAGGWKNLRFDQVDKQRSIDKRVERSINGKNRPDVAGMLKGKKFGKKPKAASA